MTNDSNPNPDPPVPVPVDALEPETLTRLVESFVLREGTDYGHADWTLEKKVAQVRQQLQRGEAHIVFDPATETVHILPRDELRKLPLNDAG